MSLTLNSAVGGCKYAGVGCGCMRVCANIAESGVYAYVRVHTVDGRVCRCIAGAISTTLRSSVSLALNSAVYAHVGVGTCVCVCSSFDWLWRAPVCAYTC